MPRGFRSQNPLVRDLADMALEFAERRLRRENGGADDPDVNILKRAMNLGNVDGSGNKGYEEYKKESNSLEELRKLVVEQNDGTGVVDAEFVEVDYGKE